MSRDEIRAFVKKLRIKYNLKNNFWTDRTGISDMMFSYFIRGERKLNDSDYRDLERIALKVKKIIEYAEANWDNL